MMLSSKNVICYQNEFFRIQHCGDCFISGHLVVFPKEEVASLSDLPIEALTALGNILKISHAVIDAVVKPDRIYTLSFGEVLPLIHFHIFPRTADILANYKLQNQTEEVNGALIFDWARKWYKDTSYKEKYLKLMQEINMKFKYL